jgi:hypothetical protein
MKLTGNETESVCRGNAVVAEQDLAEGAGSSRPSGKADRRRAVEGARGRGPAGRPRPRHGRSSGLRGHQESRHFQRRPGLGGPVGCASLAWRTLSARPRRLAWPRTPDFQSGNTGSNPVGDTTQARVSSSRFAVTSRRRRHGVPTFGQSRSDAASLEIAQDGVPGLAARSPPGSTRPHRPTPSAIACPTTRTGSCQKVPHGERRARSTADRPASVAPLRSRSPIGAFTMDQSGRSASPVYAGRSAAAERPTVSGGRCLTHVGTEGCSPTTRARRRAGSSPRRRSWTPWCASSSRAPATRFTTHRAWKPRMAAKARP